MHDIATVRLMVDRDQVSEWFVDARNSGVIPRTCGLREVDLLDPGVDRGHGDFIVTSMVGIAPWLVEPLEEVATDVSA